ncbi:DUF2613 domain-containing protein [Corynebacterium falsenii]|uniref:DUF2613 family protein n=1 Tax=Corynebacterium falsenii TaxID=108486 RepID=A0A418Q5T2_9CORY|nr:DUF2613 domain-containing protein [Corynebacterium falsenii]AHI02370.1 hypothetical protein CFAL_01030 [Corynebacterium falsenii DSM 44353]MDC7104350.1 DUF2613 domain-containing protein [Corynebacterium falsenii]RIX34094.1 DUF2613 family protein [Corynebacterium falsenii]UBI05142.1 DUF2613 domain-containing protein [Corynebacterium falsenii]UBI06887.1 DUF2613 domain-containing protein [Corynebacterium falsenii]
MAYDNESRERGSAGALIVAAVAGIVLGGALAFGAGAMADSTTLPSDEQIAVNQDNAFLGSVQYGGRLGQ